MVQKNKNFAHNIKPTQLIRTHFYPKIYIIYTKKGFLVLAVFEKKYIYIIKKILATIFNKQN